MTMSNAWDTSKLTPLAPTDTVLRAIDDDDIEGWNETEQRWDLAADALEKQQLTPSEKSGFGISVFVPKLLETRCGAAPGDELALLQSHATQHGCYPSWRDGIVVLVKVSDLLTLRFGLGESPSDCTCPPIRDAHASVWREPTWTRQQRNEALKLLGRSAIYESPKRLQQRINAGTPSLPPAAAPKPSGTP